MHDQSNTCISTYVMSLMAVLPRKHKENEKYEHDLRLVWKACIATIRIVFGTKGCNWRQAEPEVRKHHHASKQAKKEDGGCRVSGVGPRSSIAFGPCKIQHDCKASEHGILVREMLFI